jgi:hypothetical protein
MLKMGTHFFLKLGLPQHINLQSPISWQLLPLAKQLKEWDTLGLK